LVEKGTFRDALVTVIVS